MDLLPPPWELPSTATDSPNSKNDAESAPAIDSEIETLMRSLCSQRKYRELGFQLRKGLREASTEYSYLRKRGIRHLCSLLETVIQSEELTSMFLESQLYPQLQIVPVLFMHSLSTSKAVTPVQDMHPLSPDIPTGMRQVSSEDEVIGALHLLEGCCVLDPSSRSLAARHTVAKELLDRLDSSSGSERLLIGCLDALLASILSCAASIQLFSALDGAGRLCRLMKNRQLSESVRVKCAEFLVLLVDQVDSQEWPEDEKPVKSDDLLTEIGISAGASCALLLHTNVTGLSGAPMAAQLAARSKSLLDAAS